jgi:hypothetical protein
MGARAGLFARAVQVDVEFREYEEFWLAGFMTSWFSSSKS